MTLLGTIASLFLRDRRGAMAVVFGLMLFPLFGLLGMAIDYGAALRSRDNMQEASDAAALAAASQEGVTDSERAAYGEKVFDANFTDPLLGAPVVPNVSVGDGTVTVTASGNVPTYIMSILNHETINVAVRSVATIKTSFEPCFYALDPTDSRTVYVDNDADIWTKKCGAAVNSTAADAVVMDGGSEWKAETVVIAGGYVESGGEIDASQSIATNSIRLPDPFLLLDIPLFSGCSGGTDLEITSDTTINPGVYCGGLTIKNGADVTLNPGEYIIDGGDLFMEEISDIDGTGVVIFITSSGAPSTIGSIRVTDHSRIRISAPTVGTYANIAIYQDRNARPGKQNEILGASKGPGPPPEIRVDGSIYLPSQPMIMDGDARLRIRNKLSCGKMVGKSFDLRDDARLRVDCNDKSDPSVSLYPRLLQ